MNEKYGEPWDEAKWKRGVAESKSRQEPEDQELEEYLRGFSFPLILTPEKIAELRQFVEKKSKEAAQKKTAEAVGGDMAYPKKYTGPWDREKWETAWKLIRSEGERLLKKRVFLQCKIDADNSITCWTEPAGEGTKPHAPVKAAKEAVAVKEPKPEPAGEPWDEGKWGREIAESETRQIAEPEARQKIDKVRRKGC
jgi:hypothetical protein